MRAAAKPSPISKPLTAPDRLSPGASPAAAVVAESVFLFKRIIHMTGSVNLCERLIVFGMGIVIFYHERDRRAGRKHIHDTRHMDPIYLQGFVFLGFAKHFGRNVLILISDPRILFLIRTDSSPQL